MYWKSTKCLRQKTLDKDRKLRVLISSSLTKWKERTGRSLCWTATYYMPLGYDKVFSISNGQLVCGLLVRLKLQAIKWNAFVYVKMTLSNHQFQIWSYLSHGDRVLCKNRWFSSCIRLKCNIFIKILKNLEIFSKVCAPKM